MADIFTPDKRSAIMSRIKSQGNASTELRVVHAFRRAGITGWRRHPRHVSGSPDFVFPRERLAIHVHGCFWHGCSRCASGHIPATRQEYWRPKIERTQRRDRRNRRMLRQAGYGTIQIWEHELSGTQWLDRVQRRLGRLGHPKFS